MGLLQRLSIERAVLVGASNGGRIALRFALTYPERVARLVLVIVGDQDLPDFQAIANFLVS